MTKGKLVLVPGPTMKHVCPDAQDESVFGTRVAGDGS